MEGEEIGLVLSRASELRSKLSHCIADGARRSGEGGGADLSLDADRSGGGRDGTGEEEEQESLLSILEALESLEQQLSSLQALEQQQRYEREATLAQIDRSRMILLSKIKDYNGEDLEVIHETSTFAGGSVEHNDDLLLPPYSSHHPNSFVLDNLHSSSPFTSTRKFYQNGLSVGPILEAKNDADESRKKQTETVRANVSKGMKFIFVLIGKSALTIVSAISILSFAGFEPQLKRRGIQVKVSELFQRLGNREPHVPDQCPPGKVLVMVDGVSRCIVKERIEIPFESVGASPDVSYGFG